jgi:hypothetical protein
MNGPCADYQQKKKLAGTRRVMFSMCGSVPMQSYSSSLLKNIRDAHLSHLQPTSNHIAATTTQRPRSAVPSLSTLPFRSSS